MNTSAGDPGVYNIGSLPNFESCVDVDTSVNSYFYIDVFVLNASELIAFYADLNFTAGKMQLLESAVNRFFGSGTGVQNLSQNADPPLIGPILNPTISGGSFFAGALDISDIHSGSGVLARVKAQAFIVPGGHVIDLWISTDEDEGVTLADNDGNYPGDTTIPPDGIFDGPFINAQGKIAVDRPDNDGDGTSDDCDNCPSTPNADQSDIDGDGLGDLCDSDRDGDGYPNGSDDCPDVYDDPQDPDACADPDEDGLPNALDNCPDDANPGQEDADLDGMGDACDPDDDDDGVCDVGGPLPGCQAGPSGADNCPLVPNPGQEDNNGDGIGDACIDTDGDLIIDAEDNCPLQGNPSQTDSDGDGAGDNCDVCRNDPNDDIDNDGICVGSGYRPPLTGANDNCPNVSNPSQTESDGDGYGDACDLCPGTAAAVTVDGAGCADVQVDGDGDGVCDPGAPSSGPSSCSGSDNCPAWPNPEQLPPPWPVPPGDDDCDGWTTADENFIGTDPALVCDVGGWPPDIDDSTMVDIFDVNSLAPPVFFSAPPPLPYQARYDLKPDNFIDIFDVNTLAPPLFFTSCTP